MNDLTVIAKLFIAAGIVFIGLGLLLLLAGKIPFLGRLPGDIQIRKSNFSFYFPIVTCILLSALLSLILYIIQKLR